MSIEILNAEIFTPQKQEKLQQMQEALLPVIENASEEVLPFRCRPKAQNILVSVIIPIHNVEKYLIKALQSITYQTLEDLEIICVDDGSTDRSPEILAFFAAFDERITIITQPASNAGCARNRGLEIASGKYLYFMDSDDWCEPFMLQKAVDTAENEDCDIVVWSYKAINDESKKMISSKQYQDADIDLDKRVDLFNFLSPCVWHKLFRAKVVREHDLRFQEITNSNDVVFTASVIVWSKKIKTLKDIMYFYRRTNSSLQSTLSVDPFCCVYARVRLQELLKQWGLSERFKKALINSLYSTVSFQLAKIPLTLEQLIELRTFMQKNFDCYEIGLNDVKDPKAYIFFQSMFFSNENYYPTYLYQYICAVTKAKNSSYRLGRSITWLPRKIRSAVHYWRAFGFRCLIKKVLEKISK